MVSHCANPKCGAVFKYLHDGKLFTVEGPEHLPTGNDEFNTRTRSARFFWLCGNCSRAMTIASGPDRTPTLLNLQAAA